MPNQAYYQLHFNFYDAYSPCPPSSQQAMVVSSFAFSFLSFSSFFGIISNLALNNYILFVNLFFFFSLAKFDPRPFKKVELIVLTKILIKMLDFLTW